MWWCLEKVSLPVLLDVLLGVDGKLFVRVNGYQHVSDVGLQNSKAKISKSLNAGKVYL